MTQIPHETSGFSRLAGLETLLDRTRALVAELRRRWQLHLSMGRLSARHLRDIGLTRGDLDAARHGPLSQDAATRLHIAAHLQSGNW
jgi:uncharacterized protein YjiS (DUF1127 family)